MKRIIVMLSLLILSLHFTVSTFASSDTRTGNVVGGGSSDTLAGTSYSSSNSSSGGVDLTDPNATQDFITSQKSHPISPQTINSSLKRHMPTTSRGMQKIRSSISMPLPTK